jgi:hypothetical protein
MTFFDGAKQAPNGFFGHIELANAKDERLVHPVQLRITVGLDGPIRRDALLMLPQDRITHGNFLPWHEHQPEQEERSEK